MKSISPAQHQRLIKNADNLQQVFSYNQHTHAIMLEQMSNELQHLYAEHQALLDALAQNVASYNAQHSNLRKACRTATTIAGKLRHEVKAS